MWSASDFVGKKMDFGIFAALISAASWGLGTVIFEKISKKLPAAEITFIKSTLSVILLFTLTLFTGGLQAVGLRQLTLLALSGIVGITLGDTLFFMSLKNLGAKTQVLFFMLGQIFTAVLSFLILGEKITLSQCLGMALILSGVGFSIFDKTNNQENKIKGIICSVGAIICFSMSYIMIKDVMEDVDSVTASFYRMSSCTVAMLPGVFFAKKRENVVSALKDKKTSLLFMINVIVITYGGFLMSVAAIKYLNVALASILTATEPIFTLVFVYFINKEKIKLREIIGCVTAFLGITIIILW